MFQYIAFSKETKISSSTTDELPHDETNIRPVWSESLQCTYWIAENPMFPHADSEDCD